MFRFFIFILVMLVAYTLVKGCVSGDLNKSSSLGDVVSEMQNEGETIVDNTVGGAISDLKDAFRDIARELKK